MRTWLSCKTATSYLELGRLPLEELFDYQDRVVRLLREENAAMKKAREQAREEAKRRGK